MNEIQRYVTQHSFGYDSESIRELSRQDNNGSINNVITNLDEHCFGVQIANDNKDIEYRVFYIDNKDELSGLGFDLSLEIDCETRTIYLLEFCKRIYNKYSHADILDTFNAFQSQLRVAFEKLGFSTVGDELLAFDGYNVTVFDTPLKGVLFFPLIIKKEYYRRFFNENEKDINIDKTKTKKIYLILDSKNNLIKIGQSFYPKAREKTLHGESPQWDIITTWIAPINVEKELHEKFKNKRIRGEWFKLNLSDLQEIKDYMNKYKKYL